MSRRDEIESGLASVRDRIAALARRIGASERFVRFVLSNAPAIDRAMAA